MTNTTERVPRALWASAALAGVVGALVFLAAAELAALVAAPDSSPVLAVGSFVIDVVPRPVKELAIAVFGDADKVVLLIGLGVAVLATAAVAGVLQLVRPPLGIAVFVGAGGVSLAATVTRADATALSAAPGIAGTVAGCVVLELLVRRLRRMQEHVRGGDGSEPHRGADSASGSEASTAVPEHPIIHRKQSEPSVDRRAFFRLAAIIGASALVVGAGARALLTTTSSSIAALRGALRLPAARSTVAVPAGAELDIPGLSPLFTPNADFYRVDTALVVPAVDPDTWRLVIDGMVDRRVEITFDELLDMGLDEYAITLTCVSNEVGGPLVGNARWLGVPVRDVLALAGPRGDADMVLSRSVDGFTASTPLDSLTDPGLDAILAVGMNDEPLPLEHGFPVRMVVPGLYGYVSATKWLTQLTVTTFAADEAYWTPRGYSARAPIKFSSRLDTPRTGDGVTAGRVPLAGVAWAPAVGIARVEVRIDNGDWQPATLSTPVSDDAWVQWVLEWDAPAGTHEVTVRAVNKLGDLQTEYRAPIAPDGSSGWQTTLINVA